MQWYIKEIKELIQMDVFNNVYESQVKELCHVLACRCFLEKSFGSL
jgi:hypothetical protein